MLIFIPVTTTSLMSMDIVTPAIATLVIVALFASNDAKRTALFRPASASSVSASVSRYNSHVKE